MFVLTRLASHIAPRALWRWRARTWSPREIEPEISLIPQLCDRRSVALDVGAALGLYTIHMAGHARAVYAFEPQARHVESLRRLYAGSHVRVEAVALSDRSGVATLRVPVADRGRSTIETRNPLLDLRDVERETVPMRTLDEYQLRDVRLIKIDVEGHEEAVLRGASEIIQRDNPSLVIEIEDRHNHGGLGRIVGMLQAHQLASLCRGVVRAVNGQCDRCGIEGCGNHNKLFLPKGHRLL